MNLVCQGEAKGKSEFGTIENQVENKFENKLAENLVCQRITQEEIQSVTNLDNMFQFVNKQ